MAAIGSSTLIYLAPILLIAGGLAIENIRDRRRGGGPPEENTE
jgi:hypothetical protein